ncbi:MAG: glycosyltransferase family 39 protein [Anaerolineae bacterium]|nr:glycosyltransferase family 39 protein [Anaerolineae bacterium]
MWRDEVDQWRFAREAWPVLWSRFSQIEWNGPLYSPMLRLWTEAAGESAYALRYFSLIWSVLSVALIYALGRRLFDNKTAWVASTLMTFSPYMLWYAQEVKMYAWVLCLVLVILYVFERARDRHWLRWSGALVILMTLLFYSHILGPLLIPVLCVWFIARRRHSLRVWIGMGASLIILAALSAPLLRWQAHLVFQTRETGFPSYTLGQMALILLKGWGVGIYQAGWMHGNLDTYSASLFGILALIGLGGFIAKKQFRRLAMLISWLGIPFFALWIISLRSPLFTDRYLIWLAPAFYFLVAQGILMFKKLERWVAPLLLTLLLLFNQMSVFAQANYPVKPQFEKALAYLKQHRTPDALLLFQIPYNYHVMAYYDTEKLDPWREAPYTNWRLPDGSYQVSEDYVNEQMRATLAGYQNVWLVYSEVEQWDDRELVRLWLESHGARLDEQYFQGVSLYLYQITP